MMMRREPKAEKFEGRKYFWVEFSVYVWNFVSGVGWIEPFSLSFFHQPLLINENEFYSGNGNSSRQHSKQHLTKNKIKIIINSETSSHSIDANVAFNNNFFPTPTLPLSSQPHNLVQSQLTVRWGEKASNEGCNKHFSAPHTFFLFFIALFSAFAVLLFCSFMESSTRHQFMIEVKEKFRSLFFLIIKLLLMWSEHKLLAKTDDKSLIVICF